MKKTVMLLTLSCAFLTACTAGDGLNSAENGDYFNFEHYFSSNGTPVGISSDTRQKAIYERGAVDASANVGKKKTNDALQNMQNFSHTAGSACQKNGGKAETQRSRSKQQDICSFSYGKIVGEWRAVPKG